MITFCKFCLQSNNVCLRVKTSDERLEYVTFQANFNATVLFLIFKFVLYWYLHYFKSIDRTVYKNQM